MKSASFWLRGLLVVTLAILAITFVVSGGYAQPAPKVWHLRFTNDTAGPPASGGRSAEVFAAEIKKLTGGKAVVDQVLHGGALSKPGEALDHMARRVADGGMIGYMYYPGRLSTLGFPPAIPSGPPDPLVTMGIINRMLREMPEMRDEFTKENIHVAAVVIMESYNLISKKPVRILSDFKGMRIAVSGHYFPKAFEQVGAAAPAMSFAERGAALATGVIDGSCITTEFNFVGGFHKFAKYETILRFPCMVVGLYAINLDLWKQFSKDTQEQINQAGANVVKWYRETEMANTEKALAAFKEAGVERYALPDAELAKWAQLISDFPEDWIREAEAKGIAGRKIAERFIALAKEAGYVFPFEPKF